MLGASWRGETDLHSQLDSTTWVHVALLVSCHGWRRRCTDAERAAARSSAAHRHVNFVVVVRAILRYLHSNSLVTANEYYRDAFRDTPLEATFNSGIITVCNATAVICAVTAAFGGTKHVCGNFFSLPSGKPFGAHCQKPDGDDRYDKCDDRLSVATR